MADTDTKTTPEATKPKRKPPAEGKTLDDLLGAFNVAPSAETSPAEAERQARVAQVEAQFSEFAAYLAQTTQGTSDVVAIKGALVALNTVKGRAVKAVKNIPDEAILGA